MYPTKFLFIVGDICKQFVLRPRRPSSHPDQEGVRTVKVRERNVPDATKTVTPKLGYPKRHGTSRRTTALSVFPDLVGRAHGTLGQRKDVSGQVRRSQSRKDIPGREVSPVPSKETVPEEVTHILCRRKLRPLGFKRKIR